MYNLVVRVYMDKTTAFNLRRIYGSLSLDAEEAFFRRSVLDLIGGDDKGCYLELSEIEKVFANEVVVSLISHAMNQTYQDAFIMIAREVATFAGFDAIQRLADIVEPKTSRVVSDYKTPRQIALEKRRAKEDQANVQAARAQDPDQRRR